MSYLVLARKYRPQTFDDVIGQEKTVETLKGILKSGRVPHAFLFCGPRGTGKTTCARILAKELNQGLPSKQETGLDLGLQSSLDIIEIDGASNNGVDDVRILRDNVQLMSISGGNKVYIIDEVHMLTTPAFNALLKTLEEPPAHVKFIFATTEAQKIPATVLSRCQRFDFRRIPPEMIVKCLKDICLKESVSAEEEVLFTIARAAQGGMRDALSVLDQLIAFSKETIKTTDVNAMLGLVETKALFDVAEALAAKDIVLLLSTMEIVFSAGKDVKQFTKDLIEHFRDLMVMKAGGDKLQALLDRPRQYKEDLFRQSSKFTMRGILTVMEHLVASEETERLINMPRLSLELSLAKVIVVEQQSVVGPSAIKAPVSAPTALAPQPSKPVTASVAVKPVTSTPKPLTPSEKVVPLPHTTASVAPSAPNANITDQQPPFSLIQVKSAWNKITFSASRRKITIGTYLQVGYPMAIDKGRLVIGFSKSHAFHKDCLNSPEAIGHIMGALEEVLGKSCAVDLRIVDEIIDREPTSAIEEALEVFGGEIVNEWHNDSEPK